MIDDSRIHHAPPRPRTPDDDWELIPELFCPSCESKLCIFQNEITREIKCGRCGKVYRQSDEGSK